jgi:hypothetical protein
VSGSYPPLRRPPQRRRPGTSFKWHASSKLLRRTLEAGLLARLLLPRPLKRPLKTSRRRRSPTGTALALWPCARFAGTRNRQIFSYAKCRSSALCARSLRTSSVIFAFSKVPSLFSRKPLRPISLVSLRTPTSAPSTPSASRYFRKTSSWRAASAGSALEVNKMSRNK